MDNGKSPGRWKRRRKWIILAAISLLAVAGVVWNYWPVKGDITISRETTYVMGPMNEDGTINYVAALNGMVGKGVTGENNAAALLIRAFGPDVFWPATWEQHSDLLGITDLPEEGDYFVELGRYEGDGSAATTRPEYGTPEREAEAKLLDRLVMTPWSPQRYPRIDAWLKANEKPLSLITEATKRPRYYLPLASEYSPPQLLDVPLPLPPYDSLAQAIAVRAMLRVHTGRIEAAEEDILALHRLARLIGQSPRILDSVLTVAVADVAGTASSALAASGRLTAGQARRFLSDLEGLPPGPDVIDTIDKDMRFSHLDFVMVLYRGGDDLARDPVMGWLNYCPHLIDWNVMLQRFNYWCDRLVDAAKQPSPRERARRWQALRNDLDEVRQKAFSIGAAKMILGILNGRAGRRLFTNQISDVLITILMPILENIADNRDAAVMRFDVARLALALAAFKADKGKYPEKLSELSPGHIKKVPIDIFAEGPLVYKRVDKGYLLYSVGQNMTDDGGGEDADKDDIAAQVK